MRETIRKSLYPMLHERVDVDAECGEETLDVALVRDDSLANVWGREQKKYPTLGVPTEMHLDHNTLWHLPQCLLNLVG